MRQRYDLAGHCPEQDDAAVSKQVCKIENDNHYHYACKRILFFVTLGTDTVKIQPVPGIFKIMLGN